MRVSGSEGARATPAADLEGPFLTLKAFPQHPACASGAPRAGPPEGTRQAILEAGLPCRGVEVVHCTKVPSLRPDTLTHTHIHAHTHACTHAHPSLREEALVRSGQDLEAGWTLSSLSRHFGILPTVPAATPGTQLRDSRK